MKLPKYLAFPIALIFSSLSALAANASEVKITPLGSHDGEFCRFDRALIFEDPNGTRLVYDVGRTVAGAEDTRLGEVDIVLYRSIYQS